MAREPHHEGQAFRLEQFFDRPVDAWGMLVDRFGRLRRQFAIAITPELTLRNLVLHERFTFDDGEIEERTWTIRIVGNGRYEGTADNGVIGTALGTVTGNTFHWRYPFRLRMGQRGLQVTFDDWMYLQPGGTVLNRAQVSKFGIRIGELSGAFVRRGPAMAPAGLERAAE